MFGISMMPIGPLMMEHRVIERMISLLTLELDRIRDEEDPHIYFLFSAIDFLRTYADRTHHGKEEDILFRDLRRKELSPEIRLTMEGLEQDHRMSRENSKALLESLRRFNGSQNGEREQIEERLGFLTALYPKHIETEDKRFFIPSMDYFSEKEQEKMLEEFLEFDRRMIHEKYEGMVLRYESEFSASIPKRGAEGGESPMESSSVKWVCTVCDWVYDPNIGDPNGGIPPGVEFENLPDDWVCPQCGAEKDAFERLIG
ncbi:MAG: hemerythrin [Methanomassiliicoccales archaeon]|nr:hemerythrin [Methanomassiliicoccales archaeon]NYT16034.1 hemerythrin [Methanomassiliicoccales archaeon]